MKRIRKTFLFAVTVLCAVGLLLPALPANAKEQKTEISHAANGTMMMNEKYVYCYNKSLLHPPTGTEYQPSQPFDGQENRNEVEEEIRSLLYAGFPFDAYCYMQKYGIAEEDAAAQRDAMRTYREEERECFQNRKTPGVLKRTPDVFPLLRGGKSRRLGADQ